MRATCHAHLVVIDLIIIITIGGVQVMKLLIMQRCSAPYYFIPLGSKHSLYLPVLKYSHSMFFLPCRRQSYTPIQNYRQTYNFERPRKTLEKLFKYERIVLFYRSWHWHILRMNLLYSCTVIYQCLHHIKTICHINVN
jgi:hypothetical protein